MSVVPPPGIRWADAPTADVVAARLTGVRRRLAEAGADPDRVRVVAVTKGFGPAAAAAAVAVGLTDVGENYAQELVAKAAALGSAPAGPWPPAGSGGVPRWHHLGAVQRRQVPRLARLVTLWHGVCRAAEGRAIAAVVPGAPVLVQLELTGLPGRRGVEAAAAGSLVAELRDAGVEPVGVMAMGVPEEPRRTGAVFRRAVAVADDLGLPERSLGMSGDLEEAAAAGGTVVRVGRALFGDRPAPGPVVADGPEPVHPRRPPPH